MKKFLSNLLLGKIVYKESTNVSFEKVIKTLEKAIKANDFSITTVHDLKQTFTKAKSSLDKDFEYKIVQICNAEKSHKVLTTMSYDLGIMMPKSIVVARENGETTLRFMTMKPWMVGMMFPGIDITQMSKNVMGTMKKIVDETIKSVEKE